MFDEFTPVDETDDVIDSRDIVARIEHLAERRDNPDDADFEPLDEDEEVELNDLEALAAEAEPYVADWGYGETLIRDSYFTDYIRELVDDCYPMPEGFDEAAWPWRHMTMDWEAAADEAKGDYTSFEFRGVTYWAR